MAYTDIELANKSNDQLRAELQAMHKSMAEIHGQMAEMHGVLVKKDELIEMYQETNVTKNERIATLEDNARQTQSKSASILSKASYLLR